MDSITECRRGIRSGSVHSTGLAAGGFSEGVQIPQSIRHDLAERNPICASSIRYRHNVTLILRITFRKIPLQETQKLPFSSYDIVTDSHNRDLRLPQHERSHALFLRDLDFVLMEQQNRFLRGQSG